jgi:eukaryotic-like serine/threonine-protein kinase
VSAALIQTEQWGKQAKEAPCATSEEADAGLVLWRGAEASLAQAETALRTGTADDRLRQQVLDVQERIERGRAQAQRKATLLRDLDDARMTQSIWIENHFDYAGGATKYAAAFAAYDLEVKPGRTEELARRIRAEQPALREALIVALDYWWGTATRAKTVELANLVRALAAAADDDPWRRQYRAATAAKDAAALRALSAEARRLSLPPSSLELLAASLRAHGDDDEALALMRWARGRHLSDFWIHIELGSLLDQGEHKSPLILEEAIGCYRTALALRPGASSAHNNLGTCLRARNQLDEAMAEYRKAIDLDARNRNAHYNLGNALQAKNQLDEAIAEHRQAIAIDPKYVLAHYGLGNALQAKNQLDEAIAEYRQAIAIDPKYALAHYGLGAALDANHQLDEASAEYRQAIDLDPDCAEAHCNLALILRSQGQLSASLDFYKRGHALGSKRGDWRYPSERWVADAERLVRLEAKLPDVVAGKATPTDNRERLELLFVCQVQRRHFAAARLSADAFTADPKLADDLKASHRYYAARSAAMAAAGQGADAGKLDDQEQSRLRQQALAWLRADLEQWSKGLEGGKPEDRQGARARLEHWQRDAALAGVRDTDVLKKLSAQEQEAWRNLWADVAELLKKAGDAK